MGVHMEGESAMPMMLSKVGAAQYIVLLIYMMTADSIRARAQVRRAQWAALISNGSVIVLSQYEYIQQSI